MRRSTTSASGSAGATNDADAAHLKDQSRVSGIGMTSARTRERLVTRLREQGITDNEVLERIRSVPRHMFVDEALASRAYEDTALPIGHGQTISQPYIVARMTQSLLEAGKPRKVLEVGTGCGYQSAVLAPLVATLYSVERIAAHVLGAASGAMTEALSWAGTFHGIGARLLREHAQQIGLDPMFPQEDNPFPWMSEMIDLKKERNFFETRVIDYQTGGALSWD